MVRIKSRDDKAQRCFFNAACHYGKALYICLKCSIGPINLDSFILLKEVGCIVLLQRQGDMSTSSSFYAHSKISALLVL